MLEFIREEFNKLKQHHVTLKNKLETIMATLTDLRTVLANLDAQVGTLGPKLDKVSSDLDAHSVDYQAQVDSVNATISHLADLNTKADAIDAKVTAEGGAGSDTPTEPADTLLGADTTGSPDGQDSTPSA